MSDINDLRSHLFEAIQGLKNKTMDLDTAKAISDISQTIINTAKVEVDYMKVTGGTIVSSGFIPNQANQPKQISTQTGTKHIEHVPGGSITKHQIR